MSATIPLIDVGSLLLADRAKSIELCGIQIDRACRDSGFLRITNHGVSPSLRIELEKLSRQFFSYSEEIKAKCAMPIAGPAWRGWFRVGGELTSGIPDRKEGLYIGQQLAADDPRVIARTPLHGANLYPQHPADFGRIADQWFDEMKRLGQALLRGVAIGLGIDESWFATNIAQDPTCLFRIFHYPPVQVDTPDISSDGISKWGVAEHTDYGLLTILTQDDCGGLQVKMTDNQWVDVPAEPDVFVVNIGDMLDRLTQGRYRSTAHRVKNTSDKGRIAFPFFIDPSWDAQVVPLPLDGTPPANDQTSRWDNADVQAWTGSYGHYLTSKVAKVFPELFSAVN